MNSLAAVTRHGGLARGTASALLILLQHTQSLQPRPRPGLLLLLLETAAVTARTVAEQMRAHPQLDPASVRIAKDIEGLDRVVIGTRREEQRS